MKGPHLERTASLITVPPASGKFFFMFKANGWPPSRVSAMATRQIRLIPSHNNGFTLNERCTSTSNITGGSNPAPYRHSTEQTKTEQDRTNERVKKRGRQQTPKHEHTHSSNDSTTNQGDRPKDTHTQKVTVQPIKATVQRHTHSNGDSTTN